MARTLMLPELPAFIERHPALTLYLGEGDRFVDVVREGRKKRRDRGDLGPGRANELLVALAYGVGFVALALPQSDPGLMRSG
jgi:hypothetical protein